LRDFNSGDIQGNVTINDYSNRNEFKLLIHCNNEELFHEEKHRYKLLKNERSRKNSNTRKFISLSALLLLVAASWFYLHGAMDAVSLLIGAAGVMSGMATLQQANKQTPFEQRQIATLNEIHTLLRERGVR
jgi:hypothetical protein